MAISRPNKWYRSPLEHYLLNELKRRRDVMGLMHVFLHFSLLLFTGYLTFLSFYYKEWLLVMLCLFIHGTFYSFLGMAGLQHELIHKTVFKTKFLNQFFLYLCSFLTWNNLFFYQLSHAEHHKNTLNVDLDKEVILPQFFNLTKIIFCFTVDIPSICRALRITFQNSIGVIKGQWANKLFDKSEKNAKKNLFIWARVILFGHIFICFLSIYSNQWIFIFLITFASFIGTWLNKLLSLAQHMGMEQNVNDFRKNSRTVILNPMISFLYCQMNYHIEHHMYPGIPFFNLQKLHNLIKYDLPEPTYGIISTWNVLREINKGQQI